MCFSTDVNILAAQKTQKLITSQECHNVNLLLCDLFSAFRPGFVFDVIVFNPPYVPTDNEEMQRALEQRDIAASWAGGKNGREVIDNFLANVGSFLRKGGLLYLVVLQANKPNELVVHGKRLGMIATTILIRKAGVETLHVLRFKKC